MRYLLDTHAFIWWSIEPEKLSVKVDAIFKDSSNELLLSLASVWEMQIKIQLGKLTFPAALPTVVTTQLRQNNLQLLPIELAHIYALATLPHHHRDPFDRLLIAQTSVEGLTLISSDSHIPQYGIPVVW